ncbi:MAG TPA: outer membrane beta-barrel protein [Flavobacterium sp.]|nr:outer membrane beta-barrel protein [Flavobacterium sp.]
MKKIFLIVLIMVSFKFFGQATDTLPQVKRTIKVTDPFYREDQFYVGFTHSILTNRPSDFAQRSISIGSTFGFLRDFPINKQRTVAIAPGVGLAFYNLRHNMGLINPETNDFVIERGLNSNVQKLTYLEIPLEFRWRNSKMHSHKFWRIYTGIKYSYLIHSSTKYDGYFGKLNFKKNDLVSNSNIGIYVSAGFNIWNFYAYYGFKPLYRKDIVTPNESYLNMLNLGLMFYIL